MSSNEFLFQLANYTNGHGRIDNNPSLDPRPLLDELATRASRYSVNFNELVSKDNVHCLRGGYATVSSGILQPRGEVLAGGAGLCGNSKAMKVNLCSIVLCPTSDGRERR